MNPDVQTKTIWPCSALQPFIKYYGIRKFDTKGLLFPKSIIADEEILITFFLEGRLNGFEAIPQTKFQFDKNNLIECYFTCLQTSTKGIILFKGITRIVTLHFKPTGFYYIFGISPKELKENYGETSAILGREIGLLYEQILEAGNVKKSIDIIESYLLSKIHRCKRKYCHMAINSITDLLIKKKGIYSIAKLAHDFNITQQTLEVQFRTQVGIDPKTFCRLLRFKNALHLKMYNPALTWTKIAYSCGFYDQMHMLKDFKNFTDLTPKAFMQKIHPPLENFSEGGLY